MVSTTELIVYEDIDITDAYIMEIPPFMQRRTPLMVTLMSADMSTVDIQKMLEAGMSMARFSTSQTTTQQKVRLLDRLHQAEDFLKRKYGLPDWPCATCIELKTCIVKTGILQECQRSERPSALSKKIPFFPTLEDGKIRIRDQADIILTCDVSQFDKCSERQIFLDDPYLATDIKVGMEISITEDEIVLVCKEIVSDKAIKCRVIKGGLLKNMAYVCTRSRSRKNRPYLTSKDLVMIDFALKYEIDMIVINYARHPKTIQKVKKYIGNVSKRPIIISGICTPEGLRNLDDVIAESDGIMLSREFLAFELHSSLEYRMPLIQKLIIGKCLQAGKPFYLSGGVCQNALQTGVWLERELSDISHAILDGVSGFVLKQCANADHVVMVIKELNNICAAVEPFSNEKKNFMRITDAVRIKTPVNAAEAAAVSCALVANQTNARLIILPTVSGRTAKLLFWTRPACLIMTVTTQPRTTRILRTYRCCVPLLYSGRYKSTWYETVQDRIKFAVEHAVSNGWIKYKDCYVTLEKSDEECAFCDTVRIWHVTQSKRHIVECDT